MAPCPCSRCWATPSPKKESQTISFHQESRKCNKSQEKETKPPVSRAVHAWQTTSSEISQDDINPEWYPKLLLDSDAFSNETEDPKAIIPKLPSQNTSILFLQGKRSFVQDKHFKHRSNKMHQPSTRISRSSLRKVLAPGVSECGERHRQQTVISDWGDAYEECGDLRLSNWQSSNFQRVVHSSIWSDTATQGNVGLARLESNLVLPKCPTLKMPVRPGMVMAMHLTKDRPRFKLLSLNTSLQEVVDTFLRTEAGPSLPVSFSYSKTTRPKVMSESRMGMSLSENLRGYLDPITQGISFFVGSVNAKLCYKMSVCDLKQLQKIAQG